MKYIWVLVWCIFWICPVEAQYYQYTDDNGVVHFTDNLVEVPVKQRKAIKAYESVSTPPDSRSEEPISAPKESDTMNENSERQTLLKLQKLNKEKEVLDELYEQLVIRKQTLTTEKASITNSVQAADHQEKVRKLNQQIADFEIRRQAFEEKARAFNSPSTQN